MMALDQFVLWVNAETPYKTAKEYLDAVKAAGPSKMKMGGTGSKQEDQIITVAIEKATGTKFIYIPFKGGGDVAVQVPASVSYDAVSGTSVLTNILDISDPVLGAGSVLFGFEQNDGLVGRCSSRWGSDCTAVEQLPIQRMGKILEVIALDNTFSGVGTDLLLMALGLTGGLAGLAAGTAAAAPLHGSAAAAPLHRPRDRRGARGDPHGRAVFCARSGGDSESGRVDPDTPRPVHDRDCDAQHATSSPRL